jgi:SPP1 gp7 family putative phage head morphogenesis protein
MVTATKKPVVPAVDRLLDLIIQRQLLGTRVWQGIALDQVRQFDDQFVRELIGLLNARLPNVPDYGRDTTPANSARLESLFQRTDSLAAEVVRDMRGAAEANLLAVAKAESRWAMTALAEVLPESVQLKAVGANYLRSVTVARPFQGALLKDWYQGLEQTTRNVVRREIQQGLQRGQSVPNIVRRLTGTKANGRRDGALKTPRRHVTSMVRTAANHYSNHAREAVYEANADLIKGYRFVATLDFRTSKTCAGLDGQVFPLDATYPRPPMHWGCRSTTVPVPRTWREMGFAIDELPVSTRESLNGQVPEDLNFSEWFKGQDPRMQKEYLGPARFALYSQGLEIKDMLNADWKPLPVSALDVA